MEKSVRVEVDVIAQFNRDGQIIPLRVRITGEDGEPHAYTIRSYTDLSHKGVFTTPDGIYVTDDILVYECCIVVFEAKKIIHLYYDMSESSWTMTV